MREHQHIEWKEAWRDEFLRWICGFANAEGGALHLGRNDHGVVVGLPDAGRLLVDIPNKVRDLLGIIVAVNEREEHGRTWLEIVVDPYPHPISYRGHYFLRSGSTLQELKGVALDRFLLRRQGRTWDGVPVPGVKVGNLSPVAMRQFRTLASASGRLTSADLRASAATSHPTSRRTSRRIRGKAGAIAGPARAPRQHRYPGPAPTQGSLAPTRDLRRARPCLRIDRTNPSRQTQQPLPEIPSHRPRPCLARAILPHLMRVLLDGGSTLPGAWSQLKLALPEAANSIPAGDDAGTPRRPVSAAVETERFPGSAGRLPLT